MGAYEDATPPCLWCGGHLSDNGDDRFGRFCSYKCLMRARKASRTLGYQQNVPFDSELHRAILAEMEMALRAMISVHPFEPIEEGEDG